LNYSGPDGAAYHGHRQLPPEAETWVARIRAAKLQPHVQRSATVFEYGVGFGWNLMALECAEKIGYDVAPNLRASVEARGMQFFDNLEQIASAFGGHFDVVICHHTLEHLARPSDALEFMGGTLKPGGKLLLFVPYEKERKYRRYNANDKAHHLYSWTPSSLANLVLAHGFQLAEAGLRKFRFDRIAAVAALRLRLGEPGYRLIRKMGLLLLPEHEIALIATKPSV
jgi:SAM-dependent methyltransferase